LSTAPDGAFFLYAFAVLPAAWRFYHLVSAALERRLGTSATGLALLAFFLFLGFLEVIGYFFFPHPWRRLESLACRAILGKARRARRVN